MVANIPTMIKFTIIAPAPLTITGPNWDRGILNIPSNRLKAPQPISMRINIIPIGIFWLTCWFSIMFMLDDYLQLVVVIAEFRATAEPVLSAHQ